MPSIQHEPQPLGRRKQHLFTLCSQGGTSISWSGSPTPCVTPKKEKGGILNHPGGQHFLSGSGTGWKVKVSRGVLTDVDRVGNLTEDQHEELLDGPVQAGHWLHPQDKMHFLAALLPAVPLSVGECPAYGGRSQGSWGRGCSWYRHRTLTLLQCPAVHSHPPMGLGAGLDRWQEVLGRMRERTLHWGRSP